MPLADCLRWHQGPKMATLTTTHRHDYRWPKSDCLIPPAEAPNGQCEGRAGGRQDGAADRPWCGRDPPPDPSRLAARSQLVVCRDLVPTPVERPWCQRGPLVALVSPRAEPPTKPQLRPEHCPPEQPSRPWCDKNGTSSRQNQHSVSSARRGGAEGGCGEVVAARVGAAPQQEASRHDQPDQYLRKLCDKVTATPRDELMRRVYADRYRTTYQADYCTNADDSARLVGKCDSHDPSLRQPQLSFAEGLEVEGRCASHVTCQCGCGCRVAVDHTGISAGDAPRIRPIACRPAAVSHNVHFSCCTPKKKIGGQEEVGPPQKIPPWASEYTDGIGRTGQLIIEQKLLQSKKKN